MNNTCVCCGDIIPEGRQICPTCENALKNYAPKGVKTKQFKKFVARDTTDTIIQLTIDDMEINR